MKIVCLGVRGSVPIPGAGVPHFGGATTCYAIELAGERILVDAGTGLWNLQNYPDWYGKDISLLITHPHTDHLIGLAAGQTVFAPTGNVRVYGSTRGGLSVKGQIDRLFSPPLWPVGMEILVPGMTYHEIGDVFRLGNVEVFAKEGVHPGGVTVYRLTGAGKSVVIMTDCTLTDEKREELSSFAGNCDLLIIDGQYRDDEWKGREDFGHNTVTMAASFAASCGARMTRIVHHEPGHTDAELAGTVLPAGCAIAREGEVIAI